MLLNMVVNVVLDLVLNSISFNINNMLYNNQLQRKDMHIRSCLLEHLLNKNKNQKMLAKTSRDVSGGEGVIFDEVIKAVSLQY